MNRAIYIKCECCDIFINIADIKYKDEVTGYKWHKGQPVPMYRIKTIDQEYHYFDKDRFDEKVKNG